MAARALQARLGTMSLDPSVSVMALMKLNVRCPHSPAGSVADTAGEDSVAEPDANIGGDCRVDVCADSGVDCGVSKITMAKYSSITSVR